MKDDPVKKGCVRSPVLSTSETSSVVLCRDEPSLACPRTSDSFFPLDSAMSLSSRDDEPANESTCDDSSMLESRCSRPTSPLIQVKRGYREMSSTLICGVVFESDPVWMWSLRVNSWSMIYVSASNDLELRRLHPTLRSMFDSKIFVIPSTFGGDYPSVSPDIMLVSGSRDFLQSISANLPPMGVHLFWMAHSPRRCPVGLMACNWTRISHCKVGGVTDCRGTFGLSSSSPRITLKPDLRRSLSHVVKHSIRPRPCDPDATVDHYKPSDLLSISFPLRPILYSTFMSRSGWGIRSLTDAELAVCFDLPSFVGWDSRFLRDIVPIQLFRSVLDHVTDVMHESSPSPKRIASCASVAPIADCGVSTDVWLPHIGRWLPGSWSEAVIASKAVKSDNAPIDYKPWRRRIQLVFPCSDDTILVLERFATRLWRRNVCRSFFAYIRHTYGDSWRGDMSLSSHKRPAVSSSRPTTSKRCKFGSRDSGSSRSLRGVDGDDVVDAKGYDVVDAKGLGLAGSTDELDISSLLADLSSGLLVIGQILRSTWWEWTHGSSPLFWRWNGSDQIKSSRDGIHIFCHSPLAKSRRSISLPQFDIDTRKTVASKISSIINKSY